AESPALTRRLLHASPPSASDSSMRRGSVHRHPPQIPSRPVRSSHFLARWQGEMKGSAAIAIRRSPEPSAVSLHDRAADRQSHSHPLRLGRIKGLEKTLKAL